MGNAQSENSGFTLIELMVTIAVLGIMLAAALPSFADFFDKYRLRGAVDDVVSLLSNARAESVKTGLDVRIDFAGGSTAWCVAANPAVVPGGGAPILDPGNCDCTAGTCGAMPDGQSLVVPVGEHGNVSASAANVGQWFVYDSKLGLVGDLNAHTATLASPTGKYSLAIVVTPLGQANVCVPTGMPGIAGFVPC